jgi:hypothetical protein
MLGAQNILVVCAGDDFASAAIEIAKLVQERDVLVRQARQLLDTIDRWNELRGDDFMTREENGILLDAMALRHVVTHA